MPFAGEQALISATGIKMYVHLNNECLFAYFYSAKHTTGSILLYLSKIITLAFDLSRNTVSS